MTSYVLFLSSFLGSSYSSRPRPFRVFALSTTSLDSRLVATFCDSPLSTYPTHLSLRAAKGTRTRLAPSPLQSPASSPQPSAVPTLSGLIGDLGASPLCSSKCPWVRRNVGLGRGIAGLSRVVLVPRTALRQRGPCGGWYERRRNEVEGVSRRRNEDDYDALTAEGNKMMDPTSIT